MGIAEFPLCITDLFRPDDPRTDHSEVTRVLLEKGTPEMADLTCGTNIYCSQG